MQRRPWAWAPALLLFALLGSSLLVLWRSEARPAPAAGELRLWGEGLRRVGDAQVLGFRAAQLRMDGRDVLALRLGSAAASLAEVRVELAAGVELAAPTGSWHRGVLQLSGGVVLSHKGATLQAETVQIRGRSLHFPGQLRLLLAGEEQVFFGRSFAAPELLELLGS